ncbi:Lrp/AsnC family transcriptional regulator [Marinomonas sp. M1K-6]|uniref:Lrp/AsnC family transcriptional regulator n=1 Tax=Marinomonas profundi TaxID=2726122 RepID=A0A847RB28_9GAMM|nr:Lrp/AsnC family transcriptional regulator [Marinomonas profundi]NLQ18164.1 Lrp/AsnC family transcriptional regulator [Marinomonas profundi]UDV03521.1 Lrp/AsnC family transcriptional regulator [Marinomonas profundi]
MADHYDQKILALLVDDARLSVSDISRQVNLSRSAVTERIKRMEDNHIITGYHAHTSVSKEDGVTAYLALTFRPLSCDLVQPLIAAIPEVKLAHSISGDLDLLLLVQASSMARLNVIRSEMDGWPNLEKIVTHMCLAKRLDRW